LGEKGAILQEATALHVSIKHNGSPSVSTQVATLRRLLLGRGDGEQQELFTRVANVRPICLKSSILIYDGQGKLTLVVSAESADIIATLVGLKKEVDGITGQSLKLTLVGAAEGHLLAHELGQAGIGVILVPSRSFPSDWEQRQMCVLTCLYEWKFLIRLL
jgi:hypothetical protein